MLNDASGFKHIYLCTGHTDLRHGIEGLIAVVNAGFKLDPRESVSIFLFCGRRCDRIKISCMRETVGLFAINDLQMERYSVTEALNYPFNQEPYLLVFLQDALISLDNNDAERSIRSFYVGKHSEHIIDSVRGISASALLYSIAERAKANQLKLYKYFVHLLKELLKYPRENISEEELKKLMPWSEVLL